MSDLEKVNIAEAGGNVPARRMEVLDLRDVLDRMRNPLNDPAEEHPDPLPVIDLTPLPAEKEIDTVQLIFILDSVVDFLEELILSGEQLRQASQLVKDVEAFRDAL